MKIGIIGLGRIGARVARYANAFDMEVCAYDPYRSDEYSASLGARKCTLDELIQQVDIISIHAAYTSGAKNIIGKNEIAKIKRGAVIINTARGELLDLDAAVNALRANMLDGLGLDVLPQENSHDLMATSSFVKAARDGFNIVVTPHLGGCTIEAMTYTEDLIANLFFKNYRFSI
jgi:D-3-phosphoglycerate dehydrogenase